MGWFEEQIRQRKQYSDEAFEEAFYKVADSVTGKNVSKAMENDSKKTRDAIESVLKYYGIKKAKELPPELTDVNEQLDYLIRPEGMMTRDVKLEKGWYKDAYGAMLGTLKKDGSLIALIPGRISGYTFYDPKLRKVRKVNEETAKLIDEEAISFYKQFPLRKLHIYDLGMFAIKSLKVNDFIFYGILTLVGTLLGMLVVNINKVLMSDVLEFGKVSVLIACSLFLVCTQLSQSIFSIANSLYTDRFNKKMDLAIDSATMMNKGFEVIEAHYLFDMPYEKIDTVLHRQSIVHSMVEFNDGTIKAEIGTSDMHTPISYALRYPSHNLSESENLNLFGLNLTFEELSMDRYPCLRYAYLAAKKGSIYLAVLNAANEAAVALFLNDKIEFLDIEKIIYNEISKDKYKNIEYNLSNVINLSKDIMNDIYNTYGGLE